LQESAARLEQRAGSISPAEAPTTDASRKAETPSAITVGANVRSRDGWQGTVAEIDERAGQATIAAGSLRIGVPIDQLQVIAEAKTLPGETIKPQPHRVIPTSLDLRGARVEEALEMLDQYVDQASVAGAGRVTVIHGHGSGALRDALRTQLSGHALVKSWRPGERGEGGDGATIVEL
jgi:DNA mismatch repair protein MutS2